MIIQAHFGKPKAQKISGNEECRNWDPTDKEEGNPWNLPPKSEKNINGNIVNEESGNKNIDPIEEESGNSKNYDENVINNSGENTTNF